MHPRSVPGRQPMAAPGTRARGTVAKTAGIGLTSHARSRICPGPRPAGALGVAPGGSGAGAEDRRADTHDGRALLDSDLQIPAHPHRQVRSEEHTSELQSRGHIVCRLLLEKTKQTTLYCAVRNVN